MKNLYIPLLVLITTTAFAQTTIFSESIGIPAATTLIPTYTTQIAPATFQNNATHIFTGTADARTLTPSNGYSGATGNGCVFLAALLPSKNFQIDGINTLNYTDLTLSFGQWKGTDAASNELTVQVSEDGINWNQLNYTRPTGAGTSVWTLITPSGTIPSTANLHIKFENPTHNLSPLYAGFRIDDIKITGTPDNLSNSQNTIAGLKVYPNPAKNNLYVSSDSFVEKQVELYNVLGKVVLKTKVTNTPINISNLTSGIYIAKVTEEGKTATRKLVIE